MEYDERIKLNVFEEQSTNRNDYRKYPPQERVVYTWPKQVSERAPKPSRPYIPESHYTFEPYRKGKHVPFDILCQPRPITQTDPRTKFKMPEPELDLGKEEAIRNRPRRYMSPAVSIDDIPDLHMRDLVCKNMYLTDWRRAEIEAAKYIKSTKRSINETINDTGKSLELEIDLHPPLPDGWREIGTAWDVKQKRASVDPTKTFWKHSDIEINKESKMLQELVPQKVKNEITELIREERLRIPHDKRVPGYNGYKPRLPEGVPLAKVDLPITHPMLTVPQALGKRYE